MESSAILIRIPRGLPRGGFTFIKKILIDHNQVSTTKPCEQQNDLPAGRSFWLIITRQSTVKSRPSQISLKPIKVYIEAGRFG
jgi:hypothetical protein